MMKKLTLILTIIIFILVLIGSILIYNWTRDVSDEEAETAIFSATVEDEGGVAVSSSFLLTFQDPVSSAAVNKALTVSPEIDFGVHQGSSRQEVLISPGAPLSPDTVYTFTLSAEETICTWTIQTQEMLRILRSSPVDEETGIDLNASLEIVLSSAVTVDLDNLKENLTITPEMEGNLTQDGRLIRFTPEQPWQAGTVYHVELSPGVTCSNSTMVLEQGYAFSFETKQNWKDWTITGPSVFCLEEPLEFRIDGLPSLEPGKELGVDVSIYAFSDEDSYVAALETLYKTTPTWSCSFKYLSSSSTEGTQQIYSAVNMVRTEMADGVLLSPDIELGEGYYLLRATYGGENRDLFFMVSSLNVWVVTDADQAVVWCFDQSTAKPVEASITDLLGGDRCVADNQGLGQITIGDHALLRVTDATSTLILPLWKNVAAASDFPNVWRYLYCDKTVYANGDTVRFYGLLKTRDGSKLDYDRVSVYIVPAGDDVENYIYRDYADLVEGMFSGEIVLPQLLAGEYELQIWQSGLQYIQQPFMVSDESVRIQPISMGNGQEEVVYLDLGDEYTFSTTGPDSPRLYVQANGGITNAEVTMGTEYSVTFDPPNQLDSYVVEVEKKSTGFAVDSMTKLCRAVDAQALKITLESPSVLSCSIENTVRVSVKDGNEAPIADATVLIQVLECTLRPQVDTLAEIYGDYEGSGLSLEQAAVSDQSYGSGTTLAYEMVTTDEAGYAECTVSMPVSCQNKCYLIAQVIQCGEPIQVGSLVKYMETAGSSAEVPEETIPLESKYFYEIQPLSERTVLHANSRLVICASDERLQIMDMLLEPAFSDIDRDQAKQAFSKAYARQLLSDYGGDSVRVLFDTLSVEAAWYQKSDGGVGNRDSESDLTTSAIVASMTPSGISYYALQRYFTSQLESGIDLTDQAIALAGLASCGQATLTEIKAILQYKETNDYQFCWLIWGLLCNGDRTTAAQLYKERTFTDLSSGEASAWRGVVAAALGRADEALELLARAESKKNDNWWAERVLVARSLLIRTVQPELTFRYIVNGETYDASVSGIVDYLISPMNFTEPIYFTNVDDGVSYCNIYWLETQ